MENKKTSYWKFIGAFLAIIVLALAALAASRIYGARQAVQNAAEALRKSAADDYRRALADTYGGKTPQETLQMYTDAVEKGDYVLASKYFVVAEQEKWAKELVDIAHSNKIDSFLSPIRQAQESSGEYSSIGDTFAIHNPVLISFIKYPSGIWKIIEI